VNIDKKTRHQGMIVNVSRFLKRLVAGDHVVDSSAASLRNVIVWLFIALVALFLTHPSSPVSAFDAPVPWPAELGIDTNLGM
jgi:hypothetical protein